MDKAQNMDLQTRKLEFIKEFLKIQSEEVIERLEKLLKKESKSNYAENDASMTSEELNNRVAESESDFENGHYKKSADLLSKYK
ncbi:hypothetical protein [Hyunsoonleella aquatilis]|nr:hypothetical protein [Hyunsoonleella aquatilis]